LKKSLKKNGLLRVVITAGPTRAYLDRVRYLTNYSTGELGFLLAEELTKKNIEVVAIVGPNAQPFSKLPLKNLIEVETAQEMSEATLSQCFSFEPQVAIFAAAVLDFVPQKTEKGKVSSKKEKWVLELVPTPKIIDEVGQKFPQIKRVGFKLEWDVLMGTRLKNRGNQLLREKDLTALCLNFLPQISKKAHPLWLFSKIGPEKKFLSKREAARGITQFIQQVARP